MKIRRMTRIMTALALAVALLLTGVGFAEATVDPQKLDTYYSLAVNYIGREDYDKALEYLTAALNFCDETTDAELCSDIHLKIGCVYTMQKQYDTATAELDEAIRIKPELSEAYLVKTQVYSDTGAYDDAIESLEKYIELSGDATMYETLAQLYSQVGNAEKALESYQAFSDASSENGVESAYRMGLYEMNLNKFEEAIAQFEACVDDDNYGPTARYNIGVCKMSLADYAGALEMFNACADLADQLDGLHYNTGVCNMSLEQYPEAIAAFTASIESESYQQDATYNRAVCHMSIEEYLEAIEDFTTYIDALNAVAAEPAEPGRRSIRKLA